LFYLNLESEVLNIKKYNIIYADPPWKYNSRTISGTKKGNPEDHYNVMSIDSICNLQVNKICNDNCILFLWTTYPKYAEALKVIESWDFTYKTIGFQLIKLNKSRIGYFFGLGRWTRGNTEPCLIATRGKPKRISASISQIIESPIEKHSKKPDIVRTKIIELVGDLPRIELFAREKTEGWDVWGNEVDSDINLKSE
jgi:N6-adenosine-specific RNA methylase IME4